MQGRSVKYAIASFLEMTKTLLNLRSFKNFVSFFARNINELNYFKYKKISLPNGNRNLEETPVCYF
jgi:hypothetical protein